MKESVISAAGTSQSARVDGVALAVFIPGPACGGREAAGGDGFVWVGSHVCLVSKAARTKARESTR